MEKIKQAKKKRPPLGQVKNLRVRLEEAEETLRAIRGGEVDALVISGAKGEQVYTLQGADRSYRILLETMGEGAAALASDGMILYCNHRLSEMLKVPLEQLTGSSMENYVSPLGWRRFKTLLREDNRVHRREFSFQTFEGRQLPVLISLGSLPETEIKISVMTAADLTEQKWAEEEFHKARTELEIQVNDRTKELRREIDERKKAEEKNRRLLTVVREEKERLSALLNSIQDEVWFADAEERLTWVNPAVTKVFGSNVLPGEHVEKVAERFEVFRPDGTLRPPFEAPPLRALRGEVVEAQEELVRTPATGQLRHRQVSAAPVRDASGNVIGSVSVVRDITEGKRVEEKLRLSEEKFAKAFNLNPAAMAMTRLEDGQIMEVNETWLAMFGYSREEVIDSQISPQLWPTPEARARLAEELREKGSFHGVEQRLLRRSGEPFVTLGSAELLTVAGEEVVLSTWLDISDRKKPEEPLRASEGRPRRTNPA